MTALSSEDQRIRGEQLGADRYLVKSQVGIEDVVRTVHEVLADAPVSPAQQFSTPTVSAAPRPAPTVPPREATPPQAQPTTTPVAMPAIPQPPTATPTSAPQSAFQPTPPAAAPVQPAEPTPAPSLPQPTAPFSSPRPGANTPAGGKVIEPISSPDNLGVSTQDFAAQIEQELSVPQATSVPEQPTTPGQNPPQGPTL